MSVKINKINKIIALCQLYDIEIVSYGLAPNPNGFCYEKGPNTTPQQAKRFNELFNSLNNEETNKLREIVFGA